MQKKIITTFNLLTALLITAFFWFTPRINDDISNYNAPNLHNLSGIIHGDYLMFFHWSSRILINFIMFVMTDLAPHWLFAIITGGLIFAILHLLTRLANPKREPVRQLLIISILLTFNFIILNTAGWIATTVTYLWPFGALAIGILLYQQQTKSKIIKALNYLLTLICFLFAFNNEQLAIAGLLLLPAIKLPWKRYLLPGTAITINVLLVIFSPGNHARKLAETKRWFPAFQHFNLIQKLDLGTLTTIQHYLFGLSLPLITLTIVLVILNLKRHPIISWLPLGLLIATNLLGTLTDDPKRWTTTITQPSIGKIMAIQYMLAILLFALVIYLLPNLKARWWLTVAILVRVAMGMSPTLYASASRTFAISDGIIIMLSILISKQMNKEMIKQTIVIFIGLAFGNLLINTGITYLPRIINTNQPPLNFWEQIPNR